MWRHGGEAHRGRWMVLESGHRAAIHDEQNRASPGLISGMVRVILIVQTFFRPASLLGA